MNLSTFLSHRGEIRVIAGLFSGQNRIKNDVSSRLKFFRTQTDICIETSHLRCTCFSHEAGIEQEKNRRVYWRKAPTLKTKKKVTRFFSLLTTRHMRRPFRPKSTPLHGRMPEGVFIFIAWAVSATAGGAATARFLQFRQNLQSRSSGRGLKIDADRPGLLKQILADHVGDPSVLKYLISIPGLIQSNSQSRSASTRLGQNTNRPRPLLLIEIGPDHLITGFGDFK